MYVWGGFFTWNLSCFRLENEKSGKGVGGGRRTIEKSLNWWVQAGPIYWFLNIANVSVCLSSHLHSRHIYWLIDFSIVKISYSFMKQTCDQSHFQPIPSQTFCSGSCVVFSPAQTLSWSVRRFMHASLGSKPHQGDYFQANLTSLPGSSSAKSPLQSLRWTTLSSFFCWGMVQGVGWGVGLNNSLLFFLS